MKKAFSFFLTHVKYGESEQKKKTDVETLTLRVREKRYTQWIPMGEVEWLVFPIQYTYMVHFSIIMEWLFTSFLHYFASLAAVANHSFRQFEWCKWLEKLTLENGNLKYLVKTMTFQSQTVQTTTISSRNSRTNNANERGWKMIESAKYHFHFVYFVVWRLSLFKMNIINIYSFWNFLIHCLHFKHIS